MLSRARAAKVTDWRHPGFSIHAGNAIVPEDTKTIQNLAGYAVRKNTLRRAVGLSERAAGRHRSTEDSIDCNL
jgi:hypothetical protein